MMHVISRKALRVFREVHPEAEPSLDAWERVARRAAWTKFADIRATFNSADVVGEYVVFNVGGNKFRIVAEVIYDAGQLVLIRGVYTHAEYDRLDLA